MTLRFNDDGTFRILQMADIQDGPQVNDDTIRLIEAAIREAKPDLVVFTGDQVRGYDPAYIDTFLRRRDAAPGTNVRLVTEFEAKINGIQRRRPEAAASGTTAGKDTKQTADTAMQGEHISPVERTPRNEPTASCRTTPTGNQPAHDNRQPDSTGTAAPDALVPANHSHGDIPTMDELMDQARGNVRRTFAGFLKPVVDADVPFAATYGNHDFQCGILPDEQDDLYREFPGCLNPVAPGGPYARNAGTASSTTTTATTDAAHTDAPVTSNAVAQSTQPVAAPTADPLALEPGTFALPIEASDGSGRITMAVMMVNSGDYAADAAPSQPQSPHRPHMDQQSPHHAQTEAQAHDHSQPQAQSWQQTQHDAQAQPSTHAPSHTPDAQSTAAYQTDSRGLDLADSDGYGTPTPEAIAWLGSVQHTLGECNGDGRPVPSIVFQHIPPQEFYDCLKEVPAWTPNAVEGSRTHAGHCYALDTTVCRPGSRLGEAIGCADENVGQVEAMRAAGGYFALFCGHDHKNSFVGHVHDMDLGYAPTCGFECYGPKSRLRGIRLFEFHEYDPTAYETRMLTWGDLIGRYSSNELRVFFEDHCVTDAIGVRNELRRPQMFATLAGVAAAGLTAAIRTIIRKTRTRRR